MGGGDLHEAVAAGPVDGSLPGAHQRVVGARERDPVDEHELAGVAGHVEPLPEREGAEQGGVRVVDELPGQLGQLGVALGQRGEVRQPLADGLRRGLGGPATGEQPECPALAGVDQRDDLVELGLPQPVAAGRRQVTGDVEDRLLAVVERAADVDATPRENAVGALVALLGRGDVDVLRRLEPELEATALKSPPSRSVALVKTASLSVSSLSRIGPQTWSGATHR